MRKEFARLRKENNINWFIRNSKLINWLIFGLFAILFFASIIATIVILIKEIPSLVSDIQNIAPSTPAQYFNFSNYYQYDISLNVNEVIPPDVVPPDVVPPDVVPSDPIPPDSSLQEFETIYNVCTSLDKHISVYWTLMSVLNLCLSSVIGMFVSRIVANLCLIGRNIIDYKKINISKKFFIFRTVMLSVICLLILITVSCFGASFHKFIFVNMKGISDSAINLASNFSKEYVKLYDSYINSPSDMAQQLNGLISTFQNQMQDLYNVMNNLINPQTSNVIKNVINVGITFLAFIIIWGIVDIVYGSITLAMAPKALK